MASGATTMPFLVKQSTAKKIINEYNDWFTGHYPVSKSLLKRCFGDCILSPSSGKMPKQHWSYFRWLLFFLHLYELKYLLCGNTRRQNCTYNVLLKYKMMDCDGNVIMKRRKRLELRWHFTQYLPRYYYIFFRFNVLCKIILYIWHNSSPLAATSESAIL
jgi:hypothetical protein